MIPTNLFTLNAAPSKDTSVSIMASSFASAPTKYSIKTIGEDFKPIPEVKIVSEVEEVGVVTGPDGCAILLSGPSDIFNAAKFVASKKGYLPYALIVEPGKTEITVVLKKDPDQKAGKKEKGKKKK